MNKQNLFYKKIVSTLTMTALVISLVIPALAPMIAHAVTVTLAPNGIGNYNQWSTNTGTKIAAVAADDGDTAYIRNDDDNDRQSFAFPGAVIAAGSTINSVTLSVVAKRGEGGAKIKLLVEKG